MIRPDDLVDKVFRAEYLIQQQAGVGVGVPVEVQVQRPVGSEQPAHQRQALIQELQIRVQVRPRVPITFGQFPLGWFARILPTPDARIKFSIGEKRGIGVDEVDAALVLGQQGSHHGKILTQDQPVVSMGLRVSASAGIKDRVTAQSGRRERRVTLSRPVE